MAIEAPPGNNTTESCGYLYIAIGKRYVMEAQISARSLRRFTSYPVCLITDDETFTSDLFDKIIITKPETGFTTKIIGMALTPFYRTIYLDSDTFVCSSIDLLFTVLDLFDMSMSVDNFMHSYGFINKYAPSYKLPYEKVIPEYNTGVVVYRLTSTIKSFLAEWLKTHHETSFRADMPSFRETYLKYTATIRISPLPFEYNYYGTHSFGFAYNEIKVIHERLGERWNSLTTVMLPFEKMEKKAKQYNRHIHKRVIIPYLGPLPYWYSPYRIKVALKKLLGIKKTKKAETF